jgi:4,5-DOPA dioxygenase extradiol
VETGARPQTIHDFGGFPPELYQRRYPAPGDPALAAEVQALLARSGIPNRGEARGFDHGVWVPLSLMYPEADVPVIALSLLAHGDPADHLALGRALSPLTDAGVLILASGGAIHNLGALGDGAAPAWALAFDQWLADTVAAGDHDALVHYRQRAPQAAMNHPTSEHFLPLLVACGAAGPQVVGRRLHQGFTYGSLGMAAFAWGKRD